MSDLVLERRRDVDRRVGDDQDLVIRRHVHDEHVTDAPSRAQARFPRDDRAQQLVGVQAALHQQLGLALAHQLHGLGGRRMAVRRIDDPRLAEIDAAVLRDLLRSWRPGRQNRRDQSLLRRPRCAPASADSSQGCATAVGTARGFGIAPAALRTFRFQLSRFMHASLRSRC